MRKPAVLADVGAFASAVRGMAIHPGNGGTVSAPDILRNVRRLFIRHAMAAPLENLRSEGTHLATCGSPLTEKTLVRRAAKARERVSVSCETSD